MSTTQQAPSNLYFGQLPELNPNSGGEFVMPEDGWHELIFKIRHVTAPDGSTVPEVREKIYRGEVQPGQYQVRLEFHINDPDTDVTPWRQWIGWTIGDNSRLRPLLLAIRNNTPFPEGQALNIDFLRLHENKPFRALITVDEVPSRTDPARMMYFANIAKVEPVTKPRKGTKAAKAAPPPVADDETDDEDTFPEIPSW